MAKMRGKVKKGKHKHKTSRSKQKDVASQKKVLQKLTQRQRIGRYARLNRQKTVPKWLEEDRKFLKEETRLTTGEGRGKRKVSGFRGGTPAYSIMSNGYNFLHRALPNLKFSASWRSPPYNYRIGSQAKLRWKLDKVIEVRSDASDFMALPKQEGRFGAVTYLWHGTSTANIEAIAERGMVPGRGGLLGAGIYLTPDFDKAWNYSRDWYSETKAIILCAARLGKVWKGAGEEEKNSKRNAEECFKLGFDTAFAGRGNSKAAWGGRLTFSEYCCYNDAQVIPVYVVVFKKESVTTS
jgi:hypothetical protein